MNILAILPIMLLATTAIAAESADLEQIGTLEQGKESYKRALEWAKEHPGEAPPLTPEEDYAIFGKDGLPRPGGGVHIMPANKMHYNQHQVMSIKANANAINSKGYIEKYNQSATNLLMFHQIANADFSKNHDLNPQSTHLRHNYTDLKMAYDYQRVPSVVVKEVIGFAPESTFIDRGWTGAVEFFKPQDLDGICSYHEVNIGLTGSSANFAQEIVSNQVNDKVSIIEVSGNDASGYGYNVEWWDNNFRHVLECASKSFKPGIKQQAIALAVNIDNR